MGYQGQDNVRGEPIRGKVGSKEEEGRCMSVGYHSQGYPIRNWLFPDTGKPPASVYCTHFLEKPGTLSLSSGVFTTPSLDSIGFSA